MFAPIYALETNQTYFKHQLLEVLMTSHNNEHALKANTVMLNNMATMLTTIMNKLESKTMVSPPPPLPPQVVPYFNGHRFSLIDLLKNIYT